jgi:hypothetical protein
MTGVMRLSAIAVVMCSAAIAATAQAGGPQCQAAGQLVRLPDLPEASGVAASVRTPGRLWAHNDSGSLLVALDGKGAVSQRVQVSGATIADWEAVAAGPCPGGACLYLADIGDNVAKRERITIYRLPEPTTEAAVAVTEVFHATYPDGPRDAETLLVSPDGALFIVTKGETDAVSLYRFPRDLRPGASHRLERVGPSRGHGKATAADRVTDGAISPDGAWVVLRTRDAFTFHRSADLFAGAWAEAARVDVTALGEPQGEGIAVANDGTVYLTGEGGAKGRPGTFARFDCTAASASAR